MEYIVGIILIIGFIVYKMYKKGRAITDTYIIASEKAFIIFAEDPYGVLKSLCQQGDNFPTSKRILRDYELFKDFQMATQTLSHEEKELFAEDISFAMLGLITFFIYGENRTEKNFNDVHHDLKHNFEFSDSFKQARRKVLFLYGILYLN
ncbi:hypothetical protein EUX47_06560 [Haemophilus haemolyticus]|jgi:hypothetical protein|uniref:hypothetical protein n=1 Tax=Haemophilus haemolyticus TaxID=726 RepID=UPI000DABA2E1|nr:hypothetical protein [Haemophilus haemolyticus]RDE67959.1 hypothetical protein DPV82_05980 [Haemophilus haemolyticus]TPH04561.1 hypothetical protein EUX47_06560 [Haemophilus haemolyticus]TPH25217.1 hypothetical protein EUX46_07005 [Haemophilus haemolyticus]